jgi:hypothetical protein
MNEDSSCWADDAKRSGLSQEQLLYSEDALKREFSLREEDKFKSCFIIIFKEMYIIYNSSCRLLYE